MRKQEAGFSPKTVGIIAGRSGYRCAFPDCNKATTGPGPKTSDVEKIGTAAHIFSASKNGPRGTGGLTIEQRSSPSNGIWLCENHGKIIDNNKGKNYPASMLMTWKALHESIISSEVKGLPSLNSLGWLKKLEVKESPLFKSGASIQFGKVTLISGKNGSGKTALCDWLASLSDQFSLLNRWKNIKGALGLQYTLEYIKHNVHTCKVRFVDGSFSCEIDGRPSNSMAHAFRTIFLRNENLRQDIPDNIEMLAKIWGIHPLQVREVILGLGNKKYGEIKHVEIRDEMLESDEGNFYPVKNVYVKIGKSQSFIVFNALSMGQQYQLILSGAIRLAEIFSEWIPTMLIVDLGTVFPDDLLSFYTERLGSHEFYFQAIFIAPTERPKVNWSGWSIARLKGDLYNAEIDQEIISI